MKTTVTAGEPDELEREERERLGREARGGSGGTAEDVGSFEDDASQREILREDRISTTYKKR